MSEISLGTSVYSRRVANSAKIAVKGSKREQGRQTLTDPGWVPKLGPRRDMAEAG